MFNANFPFECTICVNQRDRESHVRALVQSRETMCNWRYLFFFHVIFGFWKISHVIWVIGHIQINQIKYGAILGLIIGFRWSYLRIFVRNGTWSHEEVGKNCSQTWNWNSGSFSMQAARSISLIHDNWNLGIVSLILVGFDRVILYMR